MKEDSVEFKTRDACLLALELHKKVSSFENSKQKFQKTKTFDIDVSVFGSRD